jgi:hypothetical protein
MFRAANLPGLAALTLVVVTSGCRVSAEAKASTSGEANASANAESTESTPAPATETAAEPAPPAPPESTAGACPITCYAAQGARAVSVTPEEETQLRGALAPVFGRMRGCTEGRGFSGRLGSPTVNLRIASDGSVSEIGVDPHHGWAQQCMADTARGSGLQLALPGRHDVRCREQCPRPERPARTRTRTRAPKKAPPAPSPAPAPAPAPAP